MRTVEETTVESVRADLAAVSDDAIVAVSGVVFIGLAELGFMAPLPLEVEAVLAAFMVGLVHIFSSKTGEEEKVEEGGDNAGA